MGKKFKIFSTIAMMCFTVAVMVFGVYAASTVTFNISSYISYEVEDVYCEIETRVYSTNNFYTNDDDLAADMALIESADFDTVNSLVGSEEYGLSAVQIKNPDSPTDFSSTNTDYIYSLRIDNPTSTPSPLGLNLTYKTDSDASDDNNDAVYSYLIMTKITNISDKELYAYIDSDTYDAPANSRIYKTESYVTLDVASSGNASAYIIFAMTLQDPALSITNDQFNVPIKVTKDFAIVPKPPATLTLDSKTKLVDTIEVSSSAASPTIINVNNLEHIDGTYVQLLNFQYQVPTEASIFKFSYWVYDSAGNQMTLAEEPTDAISFTILPMAAIGNYSSVAELIGVTSNMILQFTIAPEDLTIAAPENFSLSADIPAASEFESLSSEYYSNGKVNLMTGIVFGTNVKGATIKISTDKISGLTYGPCELEGQTIEAGEAGTISSDMFESLEGGVLYNKETFIFNNVDTSNNYVKITATSISYEGETAPVMLMVDNVSMQNELSKNDDVASVYSQVYLGVCLTNGYNAEGEGVYNALPYSDINGYSSWIIPTTYFVSGLMQLCPLCTDINNTFSFTISFEYVNELDSIYQFVACTDLETGKEAYSFAGYIWAGFLSGQTDVELEVPSSYNGKNVTQIEQGVFERIPYSKVILPSTINKVNGLFFDGNFSNSKITSLILNCDPMILTKDIVSKDLGTILTEFKLNSITLNAYNGELPTEFLTYSKTQHLGISTIYVPSEFLEDAKSKYIAACTNANVTASITFKAIDSE